MDSSFIFSEHESPENSGKLGYFEKTSKIQNSKFKNFSFFSNFDPQGVPQSKSDTLQKYSSSNSLHIGKKIYDPSPFGAGDRAPQKRLLWESGDFLLFLTL